MEDKNIDLRKFQRYERATQRKLETLNRNLDKEAMRIIIKYGLVGPFFDGEGRALRLSHICRRPETGDTLVYFSFFDLNNPEISSSWETTYLLFREFPLAVMRGELKPIDDRLPSGFPKS